MSDRFSEPKQTVPYSSLTKYRKFAETVLFDKKADVKTDVKIYVRFYVRFYAIIILTLTEKPTTILPGKEKPCQTKELRTS